MSRLPRRWDALAWTDFERLPRDTVAILPVAAIEQHGPHLPLAVDATLNTGILERGLELCPPELPLLVLPLQPVGFSLEHARFPGTLTLRPETVLALWADLGDAVARAGIRKLVIFNSHGGQPQLVEATCRRLRAEHRMLAVGVSWFDLRRSGAPEQALPETERRYGIHAGAVETAMMMHLAPDAVRGEAIADFTSSWAARAAEFAQLEPHGAIGFGWETQDLHPSGAVGDPRPASAAMGAQIVAESARALADLLAEIHRFDAGSFFRAGPISG